MPTRGPSHGGLDMGNVRHAYMMNGVSINFNSFIKDASIS